MIPTGVKNILKRDLKKYKALVVNTEGEVQEAYNKIVNCIEEILEEWGGTYDKRVFR